MADEKAPRRYGWKKVEPIPERPELVQYKVLTPKGFTLTICKPVVETDELPLPHFAGQKR